MKVLSWDVGIKNLSYCMININDNWKIEKWDIINLIKDNKIPNKNNPLSMLSICKKDKSNPI